MEIVVKGVHNVGFYSIFSLYCAVLYGYKAMKDHKKLHILCGILWTLVTISLVYEYITGIFATSTIL